MSKENKPYNLGCDYVIEAYNKHPTLLSTHTVEVIHVPDYAIDYVLDVFIKIGVIAVCPEDYDTLIKYNIWPRYIIKGDLTKEELK